MMFSLAFEASAAALPAAARDETDEGVVGRAEAVEEGVVGRAEVGVAGRAKAAEGVVGRPPEEDDGVVGRAEEDVVDPRPPDEVRAGGGAAAAATAGERRDRNGEMLERVDFDDDDIAADLGPEPRPGFGGLGFWWGAGEHERELVGEEGKLVGFALVCRRRLPQVSFASLGRRGLFCRFGRAAFWHFGLELRKILGALGLDHRWCAYQRLLSGSHKLNFV